MTTIVIASNRQDSMRRWLTSWQEFKDQRIILVEDNPTKTFKISGFGYKNLEHYAWDDIDADLGDNSWIIPRHTSAIKSYGFLKAKGDITWTLDDDCFPVDGMHGYISAFERIMESKRSESEWFNTIPLPHIYPRGFPYDIRHDKTVMVHHGLWSNIPDLDGITALKMPEFRLNPAWHIDTVPYGKMFPMCGMNLAFKPEMLPAMYFQLQGHAWTPDGSTLQKLPFDRFDDIWAGLFVKKIVDHMGYVVTSGYPSIMHTKESDPQMRVEKEAPGIEVHERLWGYMDQVVLRGCSTVAECYYHFAGAIESFGYIEDKHPTYWFTLADAMRIWAELASA